MALSDEDLWGSLSGRLPERESLGASQLSQTLKAALAKGFGRTLSDADLEELSQESVRKVIEKLPSFERRSQFTTWAISIAVNTALAEVRRRKHETLSWETIQEQGEALLEVPVTASAETELTQRQGAGFLETMIQAHLTEKQREALAADLAGLPLMETARRLGSSRGAVYKMMHDARKRLLRAFEAEGLSLDDLIAREETRP